MLLLAELSHAGAASMRIQLHTAVNEQQQMKKTEEAMTAARHAIDQVWQMTSTKFGKQAVHLYIDTCLKAPSMQQVP